MERQLEMAAIGLKSHCFVEFLRVFVVEAAGAQIRRLRPVHILHGGKAADRFADTGDEHIEFRRVKELVNMLLQRFAEARAEDVRPPGCMQTCCRSSFTRGRSSRAAYRTTGSMAVT